MQSVLTPTSQLSNKKAQRNPKHSAQPLNLSNLECHTVYISDSQFIALTALCERLQILSPENTAGPGHKAEALIYVPTRSFFF